MTYDDATTIVLVMTSVLVGWGFATARGRSILAACALPVVCIVAPWPYAVVALLVYLIAEHNAWR